MTALEFSWKPLQRSKWVFFPNWINLAGGACMSERQQLKRPCAVRWSSAKPPRRWCPAAGRMDRDKDEPPLFLTPLRSRYCTIATTIPGLLVSFGFLRKNIRTHNMSSLIPSVTKMEEGTSC
jgi:hypothetical protein